MLSSDERIEQYLDRVCVHIHWGPYRARVRRELTSHILDRADYLHDCRGFPKEEAIAQAIRLLGNADELGHALNTAYHPYRHMLYFLCSVALLSGSVVCIVWLLLHLY